jgi:hypothetical protein
MVSSLLDSASVILAIRFYQGLSITSSPAPDADTDATRDADAYAHGMGTTAATNRAPHECSASQMTTTIDTHHTRAIHAAANHSTYHAATNHSTATNSAPPTDADGL